MVGKVTEDRYDELVAELVEAERDTHFKLGDNALEIEPGGEGTRRRAYGPPGPGWALACSRASVARSVFRWRDSARSSTASGLPHVGGR